MTEDPEAAHHEHGTTSERTSVVLDTRCIYRASEKAVVEASLERCPGVIAVEANPVAQSTNVTYDPSRISLEELCSCVHGCGYESHGQSVPRHLVDPMEEPHHAHGSQPDDGAPDDHLKAPADVMGHGGHGGMSMEAMTANMRNRFIIAAVFSVPIVLWSPIGRDVLGFDVSAPFGIRDDVWSLLLSLPVVLYASSIFFEGAYRALRARTLDMMVLVAVAIGTGWLYSVIITFTGGGEVFYEAATVLAAFVLLGHWFEMRARGGANEAIRTLLDLSPPMAVVLRDGSPVEVPTAEVVVGDLLLTDPAPRSPSTASSKRARAMSTSRS